MGQIDKEMVSPNLEDMDWVANTVQYGPAQDERACSNCKNFRSPNKLVSLLGFAKGTCSALFDSKVRPDFVCNKWQSAYEQQPIEQPEDVKEWMGQYNTSGNVGVRYPTEDLLDQNKEE